MEYSTIFILFVICLAFIFDFTNGFHDAGNSIATIVATKLLKPLHAVIWAAFFNLIAFLFFKLTVANTIGADLINQSVITPYLIFAGLLSAIIWNLVTWYFGIPSSSSHALIGGIIGSAIAYDGIEAIKLSGFFKILAATILSPILGILAGYIITFFTIKLTHNWNEKIKQRCFKILQLVSSALLSLSHGSNDAQKTMGILAALLYAASFQQEFFIPLWVIIACHVVMGLGTLCGGWRIVYTMANKITSLDPVRACCAETGATIVIFAATSLGAPISTTYTVTSAIAGVGIPTSVWSTSWHMMNRIFFTWIITIPITALLAAIILWSIKFLDHAI